MTCGNHGKHVKMRLLSVQHIRNKSYIQEKRRSLFKKGNDENGKETLEILVTEKADAILFETGIAVSIIIFNINSYIPSDPLVKKEQIKDSDIAICNASVSLISSSRASLNMHAYDMLAGCFNWPRMLYWNLGTWQYFQRGIKTGR